MHRQANSWQAEVLQNLKDKIFYNVDLLGGEDGGVYMHGRVNQAELAKWQAGQHIWLYPTAFMETFCITAIEAQAAGILPLTSNLAALKETVASDHLRIEGWPQNVTYQNKVLRRLDIMLNSAAEEADEYRYLGRKHAEKYTWDE